MRMRWLTSLTSRLIILFSLLSLLACGSTQEGASVCTPDDADGNTTLFYEDMVWTQNRLIAWRFDCNFPVTEMSNAREGFLYWEKMSDRSMFVEVPCDSKVSLAQITVGWDPGRYRPADPCSKTVLATALRIPHPMGGIGEARITYWGLWFDKNMRQKRITSKHEVGHTLGMRHLGDAECIMYPSIGNGEKYGCLSEYRQFYEVYGWR